MQVMKQLQEDVEAKESAGGAKGKDLKSLIKAATFAGYRMAELKFERDSKVAGPLPPHVPAPSFTHHPAALTCILLHTSPMPRDRDRTP